MGLLDRMRRSPAEAPEADAAPPAEDGPERRRIARPRGYRDTPAARAKLAEQVPGGPWHVVAVDSGALTITDDEGDPWIGRPRARTVTLTADGVRAERSTGRAIELLAERDLGTAVSVSAERRRVITADLTPAHEAIRPRRRPARGRGRAHLGGRRRARWTPRDGHRARCAIPRARPRASRGGVA